MSDLTMPGLATGLDTSSIIQQLMSIERRPVAMLQTKKKLENTGLDRLRQLNTKFLALETAAKALMGSSTSATSPFGAKTASSSNNAFFTATASNTATPGTYSMEVLALAKSQKVGGSAYLGVTANSQLQISNGVKTATINITAGDSVDTVAAAINADSASGLAASVVGGKLVLLGKTTGAAENYSLTEIAGSGNLINELGLQATPSDIVAADASITIAGVNVTSSTNTFTNALNGVNITAVATTAVGQTETLTVNSDQTTTVNAVKEMVAKFNDIVSQIKEDTKYDASTKKGGPLISDPMVKGITQQMNRMLNEAFAVTGQNGEILNYTDVGLQIQRDGTLALDETKLKAKLNSNPNEVLALFTNEDGATDALDTTILLNQSANAGNLGDGIANRLRAFANAMTSPSSSYNYKDALGNRYEGGLLSRINTVQKSINSYDDRIESYERRLELREKALRAQFVAMEKTVSMLRNQGSYLSGQQTQG